MKCLKKLVSVLLSVLITMTCFSAFTFSVNASTASDGTKVVYLKPNSNWTQANARFAIYLWTGSTTAWASMADADGDGYYEATVPSGNWTNIIFCRMNPSVSTNDWTAKWNQSDDLTIPDGMNCYTVKDATWDKGGGTWSNYSPVTPTQATTAPQTQSTTAGSSDYYLFGLINGANYGCEEDYTNLGTYKFVNGKITTTFTDDSYVAVKSGDNAKWYMTDGWLGTDVTSAELKNTSTLGTTANKLFVPGNVEVTFTLVNNGDDTFTLSYETSGEPVTTVEPTETPTIAPTTGSSTGDYYLFGLINGANYGCEEDYTNIGTYKFVNGKITTTFTDDSYVAVKSGDNAKWYMTDGWLGTDVTSAELKNTSTLGTTANKLFVPGNVEVTFTLVNNGNDTFTLSYETSGEPVTTVEPTEEPTIAPTTGSSTGDYYLFGLINGANYGCEEDYTNIGTYKFVNGKITTTFTDDSYVAVKSGDNAKWYMTDGWLGTDVTSAELKNTSTLGTTANKLFVPGNVEVTFTLVNNGDDTFTLSYETSGEPVTTVKPTDAPTTVVTTAAPTTVVTTTATSSSTSDKLVINATSNFFSSAKQTYNKSDNTVTVSFKFKSSMKVINGQWALTYDNTKLALSSNSIEEIMPVTTAGGLVNTSEANIIYGNFTNLSLYDFSNESNFVSVKFNIVGTGETSVNLNVDELGIAYEADGSNTYESYLVDKGVINDVTNKQGFENEVYTAKASIDNSSVATTQGITTTTQQPDTTQATTQPQPNNLKVNATSNLFPSASQTYNAADKTVTVTYKLTSNMKVFNGQWTLYYDNTKLEYSSTNTFSSIMPVTINGGIVNGSLVNKVKGNFTSLGLYDFTTENDFVKVTFNVVGNGKTTVNLDVEYLSVAYTDSNGEVNEAYIADNSEIKDVTKTAGYENEKYTLKTLLNAPGVTTTAAPSTEQPTTAQPTTVQPTTVQPTTVAPTTVQPTTEPTTAPATTLKVNATSNIAPPVSQTYNASEKTVTVSFKLTSTMKLINGQWTLNYDSTKLAYSSKNTASSVMPVTYTSGILNGSLTNKVKGNFTSLSLFDFSTEKDFVKVIFDVVGTGETTVNLNVEYLGVAYVDKDSNVQESYIVDNSVLCDVTGVAGFENEKMSSRIVLNEPTPSYLYGDVNNDNIINITDATLIQKHLSSINLLDDESLKRADINRDGKVDINDVTVIQKAALIH